MLCLSLLVVLSKVAVLTQAIRVVRLVCVRTSSSHFGFASLVIAVMAHTFRVRLLVSVRTLHHLIIIVRVDFRPNSLDLIETTQRIRQD